MMNLLQNASDDQVALIGCVAALAGSMALMYVSFFVGPAARQNREIDSSDSTRRFPVRDEQLSTEPPRERAA